MAGGMEFDGDVAEPEFLAIGDRLRGAGEILAITQPHHVECFLRRQNSAMAGPGVVGMAMGDHGAFHGANRVDMEAARLATKTGGSWQQDVLWTHLRYIGALPRFLTVT